MLYLDHNINEQWRSALKHVMDYGIEASPRGMKIKELIGYQTRTDMLYPVLTVPGRDLGYKFMAAEAAWILSGDNRVSTIAPFSKQISRFSDDGITYHGAYGPKIRDQLHYAADALMKDNSTRQAVINIWRENPGPTKDVPCTLSVQFIMRNDQLHVIDTMRSSDLWLGWPYDMFNFSMLARYLLLYMGVDWELGKIYLNAGSFHLYKPQWEAADDIINDNVYSSLDVEVPWTGLTPDSFVDSLWEAAHGNLLSPIEG